MIIQHWILLVSGWRYPAYSLQKAAKVVGKYAMAIAAAFASPSFDRLIDTLEDVKRALTSGCRICRRKSETFNVRTSTGNQSAIYNKNLKLTPMHRCQFNVSLVNTENRSTTEFVREWTAVFDIWLLANNWGLENST